jgi:hypothetical protein
MSKEVDHYIETLKLGQLLSTTQIKALCDKAVEVFDKEPNVLDVKTPVTVCGDIHG